MSVRLDKTISIHGFQRLSIINTAKDNSSGIISLGVLIQSFLEIDYSKRTFVRKLWLPRECIQSSKKERKRKTSTYHN